jgi:hypothetical protein
MVLDSVDYSHRRCQEHEDTKALNEHPTAFVTLCFVFLPHLLEFRANLVPGTFLTDKLAATGLKPAPRSRYGRPLSAGFYDRNENSSRAKLSAL